MKRFAQENGFFFYIDAEENLKMRVSPASNARRDSASSLLSRSSEVQLASKGSFLETNYESPGPDQIATQQEKKSLLQWKADIIKLLD